MKETPTLIRQADLAAKLGVTVSTIWRWRQAGDGFPQPVQLSPAGARQKVIAYRSDEIAAWLDARPRGSAPAPPASAKAKAAAGRARKAAERRAAKGNDARPRLKRPE